MFSLCTEESQSSVSRQKSSEPQGNTELNLENVADFSNVCRTCASITELVIPIFTGDGIQNGLADKIHKHLPIKVSETDVLPLVVCYQCASTLMAWHELVKCCEQADLALRSRVAVNNAIDNSDKVQILRRNSVKEEEEKSRVYAEIKMEGDEGPGRPSIENVEPEKIIILEADGRRTVRCGACNKSVAGVSWRRHVRVHAGERRYSCHACGRAFTDSGNLARHVRALHLRLRPHSCDVCAQSFTRKAHLDEHARSHEHEHVLERAHVCHVCGARSRSAAALRAHVRRHGAHTHGCVTCGATFPRRAELCAHVTVHTGQRAHRCACGRAFRLRSQLNVHLRRRRCSATRDDTSITEYFKNTTD